MSNSGFTSNMIDDMINDLKRESSDTNETPNSKSDDIELNDEELDIFEEIMGTASNTASDDIELNDEEQDIFEEIMGTGSSNNKNELEPTSSMSDFASEEPRVNIAAEKKAIKYSLDGDKEKGYPIQKLIKAIQSNQIHDETVEDIISEYFTQITTFNNSGQAYNADNKSGYKVSNKTAVHIGTIVKLAELGYNDRGLKEIFTEGITNPKNTVGLNNFISLKFYNAYANNEIKMLNGYDARKVEEWKKEFNAARRSIQNTNNMSEFGTINPTAEQEREAKKTSRNKYEDLIDYHSEPIMMPGSGTANFKIDKTTAIPVIKVADPYQKIYSAKEENLINMTKDHNPLKKMMGRVGLWKSQLGAEKNADALWILILKSIEREFEKVGVRKIKEVDIVNDTIIINNKRSIYYSKEFSKYANDYGITLESIVKFSELFKRFTAIEKLKIGIEYYDRLLQEYCPRVTDTHDIAKAIRKNVIKPNRKLQELTIVNKVGKTITLSRNSDDFANVANSKQFDIMNKNNKAENNLEAACSLLNPRLSKAKAGDKLNFCQKLHSGCFDNAANMLKAHGSHSYDVLASDKDFKIGDYMKRSIAMTLGVALGGFFGSVFGALGFAGSVIQKAADRV